LAKLILDIEYDYNFILFGISCHERDYRLSWALNNTLHLELAKTEDLKIDTKKQKESLSHATFYYANEQDYLEYYLIANKGTMGLLLPEQKAADFFLLIKGSVTAETKILLLKAVKETSGVLMVFEIDPNKLKSKENLLF